MRRTLLTLVIALLLTTAAAAQIDETFVISKSYDAYNKIPAAVYEISADGTIRSTLTTLAGQTGVTLLGMCNDNQSLLLNCSTLGSSGFVISLVALMPGGRLITLSKGAPLEMILGAVPNCDGDTYILNLPSKGSPVSLEIYSLRGKSLTLHSKTKFSVGSFGGIALDPETGCITFKGYLYTTPFRYGYFRVDPHTGAFTNYEVLDRNQFPINHCRDTIYDWSAGTATDIYGDGTYYARTARVTPGQGATWLSRKWWGHLTFGLVRASQRTRGVAYYTLCKTSTLPAPMSRHWTLTPIRPDGTWGKSEYLKGNPPIPASGLVRRGSRHLAWRMVTAPNERALDLSFPGEAGRHYVVLFSHSGIRPGIGLPDGRAVPIRPDGLTLLSLQGGIPGVLGNTRGRLDASGHASAKVDTNGFGASLKGTVLWAAAVVLDPKSPSGVAWIVGPERLEIRQ